MVREMSARADVAEHAAHEHHVGRHVVVVPAALGCVTLDHPHPARQPGGRGPITGERHQGGIELDQERRGVPRPWMGGQHVDHVPALPGAQAHDPDGTVRGGAQHVGQHGLHEAQPHRERRRRIVVGPVPAHPVRIRRGGFPLDGRGGFWMVPGGHDGPS